MNKIEQIKNAIENKIAWKECSGFYIGKTSDFEERRFQHTQNDGKYDFCWELAYGTPTNIAEYENLLISYYKKSEYKHLIENVNKGSAGYEDANILYVAYTFNGEFNENELHEDIVPIAEGFPVSLKK